MVSLSGLLRFWQEFRTNKAAQALKSMVRTTATVLRRGPGNIGPGQEEIAIEELVPGDIIFLAAGDLVPADVRLLESRDLFVSQSILSGESLPVEKYDVMASVSGKCSDRLPTPDKNQSLLEMGNICLMGTNVTSGRAQAVVVATGGRTWFGSLAKSIVGTRTQTAFDRGVNSVSWLLIRFMLIMVPIVLLINGFSKGDWVEASLFALAVAVGLTPEMLPMIVSSNLAKGAIAMSRRKVIVKRLNAIQNFGAMDVLCTDKTGTLTKGVFAVSQVSPANGCTEKELLEQAALAESFSSHPISKSLKNAYGKELDASNVSDVEEISGHGVTAKVNGKQVAAGNAKLMKSLNLSYTENTGVGTVVHVAVDGKYAGYILISDVIKDGAKEAIASLKNSGVKKCVMLTGDSKTVAEHVAGELKLDEVHSELLPADKVSCVEKLLQDKSEKEKLAFVGDGINDAPVLSRADIGIAMGALGSDAAIEAADVVLMDDNPAKIALAMRISRKCLRIVYENIVFALAVKAICLILGALGIANMWVAIFADVGVMVLAVLNAIRCLRIKNN